MIEPGSEADGNASVSPGGTVLVRTAEAVTEALVEVREELRAARAMRNDLNDKIRQLVADEDLLRRMARLAEHATANGDE